MKKLGNALDVAVCILVYFFIENSQLKNEIADLKEEDQKHLDTKENFNVVAGENAGAFIRTYFTYKGKLQEEKMKPYATCNALEKLKFEDAERLEEYEEEIESIDQR